jgi:large subunit ribosomal protein L35
MHLADHFGERAPEAGRLGVISCDRACRRPRAGIASAPCPHYKRGGATKEVPDQEQAAMPKLKTKSGARKRFKRTATGKIKVQAQGKRHGMIKRTAKFVRNARGTMVLSDSDTRIVKKYMPYHR